ncbi:MAG: hypothetical protein AB2804_07200 [Candidatus Thiodiazotropha endolucinida]
MGAKIIAVMATILLTFVGCSNDPVEVVSSSWSCKKKNNIRECLVNYSIVNNDDFVHEATVNIRAHRRRRNDNAVTNEVVDENTLIVKLAPKEQRSLRHNMIISRKLKQIVVSAYIAK